MEHTGNHITLCGTLRALPEYSHSNHERRFFRFELEVERLSGTADVLPVMAAEDVLMAADLFAGGRFLVEGQIRSFNSRAESGRRLIGDFIKAWDSVVLVMPIDESAPKGRIILPQQQAVRDILDANAMALAVQPGELKAMLNALKTPPAIVVTDSQAFKAVAADTPDAIPLTSFSILMARYKGFLETAVRGVAALGTLKDGDTVLIAEGCTHHRQCNDIGTVKLPNWIRKYSGKELNFEFTSGTEFPDDLSKYALVVHCGGCMLNETEMKYRIAHAVQEGVKIVNYGVAIAQMNGILDRSIAPLNF